MKFSRRIDKESIASFIPAFVSILDELEEMLMDKGYLENIYLPIECITQISRMNEEVVAKMAPRTTPKLLALFKLYHSEGQLGHELLNLFKLWCSYDKCRDIFVHTFIPFIMDTVETYFK